MMESGNHLKVGRVSSVVEESRELEKSMLALFNPIGSLEDFVSRLTNVERYWSPFGTRIPWHEPDMETVYFYDPFGNRLQVSQHRAHH